MKHENEIDYKKEDLSKDDRLNIPIVKYFWQASPLAGSKKTSFHNFFRKVSCFDHFSDYELYLFTKFVHIRNYSPQEIIFREGDRGFAFYLILEGLVDIYTNNSGQTNDDDASFVIQLTRYDYMGELALLEYQNRRNATAVAAKNTTLITVFKPDVEELINKYPVVGAKLIQALSTIVAKRFNLIAQDMKMLKEKIKKMEENANKEEV
jgi:CRP/FNR family transcriptional regulator, cyclic AMP receptor protein